MFVSYTLGSCTRKSKSAPFENHKESGTPSTYEQGGPPDVRNLVVQQMLLVRETDAIGIVVGRHVGEDDLIAGL